MKIVIDVTGVGSRGQDDIDALFEAAYFLPFAMKANPDKGMSGSFEDGKLVRFCGSHGGNRCQAPQIKRRIN